VVSWVSVPPPDQPHPGIAKKRDVELVALCDRDPEKARARRSEVQIPRHSSRIDELLDDDRVDAVDICTPNFLHAPMATAALEAGKHVLCERPLARSGVEAAGMAQGRKKSGPGAACAVQHRFRPDAQLLRTFVAKGELGTSLSTPRRAGSGSGPSGTRTSGAGRSASRRRRGARLGFQMLDSRVWVMGCRQVETVSASVHRSRKGEVEDSASALLRLEPERTLTLELTWGLLMEKDFAYLNLFRLRRCRAAQPAAHAQGHARLAGQLVTPTLDSARTSTKHRRKHR
jgi:predicted dehydrogenase